jgi:hypothetical protein
MVIIWLFIYAPIFYLFWLLINYAAKRILKQKYKKQYAILAFLILCPLLLIAITFLFIVTLGGPYAFEDELPQ